jgi:type II secretion system protein J
MNNRFDKKGFTLVEILAALAIILMIVSMVYGTYFATSKTTQTCKAKLNMLQQTRSVLEQIARQIRCAYAGPVKADSHSKDAASRAAPKNTVNYFEGGLDKPDGKILHLVTTRGIFLRQQAAEGLFEVTYKFDKTKGVLLLSQQRFTNTTQKIVRNRYWQPLLTNVESIELEFFDGQNWLPKWDFDDSAKLPYAVKIQITCRNENHQKYRCGTTAYISCDGHKNANSDSVN